MTETLEAVPPCDLGNAGDIRSSASQGAMHLLHPAEATVFARAHTQMLVAARAQQAVGNPEGRADVGHAQERFISNQILEASKNIAVAATSRGLLVSCSRETLDQGMEQLLLQPMRRLKVGERRSARFSHPDGGPMELAQFPHCRK